VKCFGVEEFLTQLDVEQPAKGSSSLDFSIAILATPTTTHAPLMRGLLKANKHILAEKPLDLEPSIAIQHFAEAASKSLGTD
jgi:predicted dehydrogenase